MPAVLAAAQVCAYLAKAEGYCEAAPLLFLLNGQRDSLLFIMPTKEVRGVPVCVGGGHNG
jgi:hypothetical protein